MCNIVLDILNSQLHHCKPGDFDIRSFIVTDLHFYVSDVGLFATNNIIQDVHFCTPHSAVKRH